MVVDFKVSRGWYYLVEGISLDVPQRLRHYDCWILQARDVMEPGCLGLRQVSLTDAWLRYRTICMIWTCIMIVAMKIRAKIWLRQAWANSVLLWQFGWLDHHIFLLTLVVIYMSSFPAWTERRSRCLVIFLLRFTSWVLWVVGMFWISRYITLFLLIYRRIRVQNNRISFLKQYFRIILRWGFIFRKLWLLLWYSCRYCLSRL